MADKISKIILQYSVAGNKQATDSLQAAAKATEELKDALGDNSKVSALSQAFDDQRQRVASLRQEFEKYREDLETSTGETEKAAEATDELAKSTDRARDARGRFVAAGGVGVAGGGGGGGGDGGSDDGGGGFSGVSGLRRTGGALSQLGLTEAGRGVSIAGDIVQLGKFKDIISELSPAVLAAGVGIGALTIAFDLYNKEQERTKALVLAEIDARQTAEQLLKNGTQQEIQIRINQLSLEKQKLEDNAADSKRILEQGQRDIAATQGLQVLGLEQVAAATGHATGAYQAAYDKANAATDALDKNNTELDILTKNSGLAAQGITDIANAAQYAAFVAGQITNQNTADLEAYKAANFGSSKALVDRIRELQLEIAVTQNSILAGTDKVKQLGAETDAGIAAKKAVDSLVTSQTALQTSLEALEQPFVATAVNAREAADALQKQKEDSVKVIEKYNDAVTKETEADLQKRADIEKKYQDDLIKAADVLADAGEKALQSLKDKQADLITSFGRGELTAAQKAQEQQLNERIKFQDVEAKNARDHARRLRDIQEQAQQEQEDAIANRDFTALFKSRRNVTQQIQVANRDFQEQEAERQLENAQKQQADQRQYEFERAQRAQAFAFANDDAQKQYDRQNKLAAANYQKALNAAAKADNDALQLEAQKHRASLDQSLAAAQSELTVIRQTSAVKKQIFDNELLQAQAILASMQGGVSGVGGFGGSSALGFAGVGSSIHNNGGNTVNNAFNLSGAGVTVQQIASVVSQVIQGYLN